LLPVIATSISIILLTKLQYVSRYGQNDFKYTEKMSKPDF